MAVNRITGRVLISTIWDTAANRDAAEPKVTGIRSEVAQALGAGEPRVTRYEIALSTLDPALLEADARAAAR